MDWPRKKNKTTAFFRKMMLRVRNQIPRNRNTHTFSHIRKLDLNNKYACLSVFLCLCICMCVCVHMCDENRKGAKREEKIIKVWRGWEKAGVMGLCYTKVAEMGATKEWGMGMNKNKI